MLHGRCPWPSAVFFWLCFVSKTQSKIGHVSRATSSSKCFVATMATAHHRLVFVNRARQPWWSVSILSNVTWDNCSFHSPVISVASFPLLWVMRVKKPAVPYLHSCPFLRPGGRQPQTHTKLFSSVSLNSRTVGDLGKMSQGAFRAVIQKRQRRR